ncbi:MAG: ABC transporter ATP-binding protein [Bacteroidia bacterium]|nr:ABC transporter ATP-binding protein [Bacteroidia bacterium]
MNPVLTLSNLSKNFGNLKAVNSVTFSVEKGSVFGILGPNGSGKTTTLGMLLGVLQPSGGNFSWFGEAPSAASLKRIGAILETPNFYPYLSGKANLKLVAAIKECGEDRIEEVLRQVNLLDRAKDKFRTYSLGMKQRLALAAALLNEPEVLVLDEPTNGLDPQGIAEVREVIGQIADSGTTILLASHLLDEVEKVCREVAILKKGELLYCGPVEGVSNDLSAQYVELSADDLKALEQVLSKHPQIMRITPRDKGLIATFTETIHGGDLNGYLFQQGIVLNHLAVRQKSLEAQFLELTNKNQ